MKTKAEITASKMLRDDTCLNCDHSKTGFKKKEPVLKCAFSGRVTNSQMMGCQFWKRKYG